MAKKIYNRIYKIEKYVKLKQIQWKISIENTIGTLK